MEIFMKDKNEIRFVPNPDYSEDWNERQREKLGDCFWCRKLSGGIGFLCSTCLVTKMPLKFPIHGCEKKDYSTPFD